MAYWREDIGINLHHWHWHLVYPFETDIRIVNKDRRGELFYYMHHQIQARYVGRDPRTRVRKSIRLAYPILVVASREDQNRAGCYCEPIAIEFRSRFLVIIARELVSVLSPLPFRWWYSNDVRSVVC